MFTLIVNHVLGHLPEWIWPAAAGAGLALYFLFGIISHFPEMKIYGTIGRPVSFLIFVIGVFFYGGAGVLQIQQELIKEAENKIAVAEQASKDVNDKLQQVIKDNEHLIKGRGYGVKQVIDRKSTRLNSSH